MNEILSFWRAWAAGLLGRGAPPSCAIVDEAEPFEVEVEEADMFNFFLAGDFFTAPSKA